MNEKKVLVIDGNSILNRAFYGIRALSTRDGQPTNAIYGLINIVSRHFDAISPDVAVMAFDLKAPTFRHKMYDEYKAGRRPAPEELLAQFDLAKQCARALGFHVLEMEGYEADDILGTIVARAIHLGMDCYVVTGDRDALQLIDPHVHILLATNNDTIDYTEQVFFEKYGVMPSQFVDVKALMGDTSDHIPGVPGIGEKTALKLIADYGSLDGVYEALPEAKLTPSVKAKLEAGKDSAYMSQKLARICREVPLDETLESYRTKGLNRPMALSLFTRLEFSAYIKRMGLTEADATVPAENSAPASESIRTISCDELDTLYAPDLPLGTALIEEGIELYDGKTIALLPWNNILGQNKGVFERFVGACEKVICHDAKALYHALEERGIHFRNCHFDTMLAGYVINAGDGAFDAPRLSLSYLGEVMREGESLARLSYRLYPVLDARVKESEQSHILYDVEMPLAAVLTDMEREGFRLNCEGIAAYGAQLDIIASELEGRVFTYAGKQFNINSPKQLGEILFGEDGLRLPAPKKTKTGYSTSAEVLEKLRPYHPIIEDILDYRQVTKLKSTYVDGLLRVVDENGQVHTTFKQTGTATGRLSSAEPNLRNIPIRTELGRELRRFFIPSKPGYLLIDADYSQIELRLMAALTEDENMCRAFREGHDIHTSTASKVFGVDPENVTIEMRKRSKAINFGILYGMGDFSLAEDLHISRKQAKEYIDNYLSSYPKIDAYLTNIKKTAAEQGYVTTMLGRRRYIPELSSPNKMVQHFGERVAMNSPIQGSAADIIKLAMIAVHRRLKESGMDAKLILQVHDELLIEANANCKDEALTLLREEMENAVKLCVPLDVSVAVGDNWYDAK
ncbi:MAG: DNA polymerase I [Clostridia bacterium]|nr:DNA polymerase I [Clostridia bacterium]